MAHVVQMEWFQYPSGTCMLKLLNGNIFLYLFFIYDPMLN